MKSGLDYQRQITDRHIQQRNNIAGNIATIADIAGDAIGLYKKAKDEKDAENGSNAAVKNKTDALNALSAFKASYENGIYVFSDGKPVTYEYGSQGFNDFVTNYKNEHMGVGDPFVISDIDNFMDVSKAYMENMTKNATEGMSSTAKKAYTSQFGSFASTYEGDINVYYASDVVKKKNEMVESSASYAISDAGTAQDLEHLPSVSKRFRLDAGGKLETNGDTVTFTDYDGTKTTLGKEESELYLACLNAEDGMSKAIAMAAFEYYEAYASNGKAQGASTALETIKTNDFKNKVILQAFDNTVGAEFDGATSLENRSMNPLEEDNSLESIKARALANFIEEYKEHFNTETVPSYIQQSAKDKVDDKYKAAVEVHKGNISKLAGGFTSAFQSFSSDPANDGTYGIMTSNDVVNYFGSEWNFMDSATQNTWLSYGAYLDGVIGTIEYSKAFESLQSATEGSPEYTEALATMSKTQPLKGWYYDDPNTTSVKEYYFTLPEVTEQSHDLQGLVNSALYTRIVNGSIGVMYGDSTSAMTGISLQHFSESYGKYVNDYADFNAFVADNAVYNYYGNLYREQIENGASKEAAIAYVRSDRDARLASFSSDIGKYLPDGKSSGEVSYALARDTMPQNIDARRAAVEGSIEELKAESEDWAEFEAWYRNGKPDSEDIAGNSYYKLFDGTDVSFGKLTDQHNEAQTRNIANVSVWNTDENGGNAIYTANELKLMLEGSSYYDAVFRSINYTNESSLVESIVKQQTALSADSIDFSVQDFSSSEEDPYGLTWMSKNGSEETKAIFKELDAWLKEKGVEPNGSYSGLEGISDEEIASQYKFISTLRNEDLADQLDIHLEKAIANRPEGMTEKEVIDALLGPSSRYLTAYKASKGVIASANAETAKETALADGEKILKEITENVEELALLELGVTDSNAYKAVVGLVDNAIGNKTKAINEKYDAMLDDGVEDPEALEASRQEELEELEATRPILTEIYKAEYRGSLEQAITLGKVAYRKALSPYESDSTITSYLSTTDTVRETVIAKYQAQLEGEALSNYNQTYTLSAIMEAGLSTDATESLVKVYTDKGMGREAAVERVKYDLKALLSKYDGYLSYGYNSLTDGPSKENYVEAQITELTAGVQDSINNAVFNSVRNNVMIAMQYLSGVGISDDMLEGIPTTDSNGKPYSRFTRESMLINRLYEEVNNSLEYLGTNGFKYNNKTVSYENMFDGVNEYSIAYADLNEKFEESYGDWLLGGDLLKAGITDPNLNPAVTQSNLYLINAKGIELPYGDTAYAKYAIDSYYADAWNQLPQDKKDEYLKSAPYNSEETWQQEQYVKDLLSAYESVSAKYGTFGEQILGGSATSSKANTLKSNAHEKWVEENYTANLTGVFPSLAGEPIATRMAAKLAMQGLSIQEIQAELNKAKELGVFGDSDITASNQVDNAMEFLRNKDSIVNWVSSLFPMVPRETAGFKLSLDSMFDYCGTDEAAAITFDVIRRYIETDENGNLVFDANGEPQFKNGAADALKNTADKYNSEICSTITSTFIGGMGKLDPANPTKNQKKELTVTESEHKDVAKKIGNGDFTYDSTLIEAVNDMFNGRTSSSSTFSVRSIADGGTSWNMGFTEGYKQIEKAVYAYLGTPIGDGDYYEAKATAMKSMSQSDLHDAEIMTSVLYSYAVFMNKVNSGSYGAVLSDAKLSESYFNGQDYYTTFNLPNSNVASNGAKVTVRMSFDAKGNAQYHFTMNAVDLETSLKESSKYEWDDLTQFDTGSLDRVLNEFAVSCTNAYKTTTIDPFYSYGDKSKLAYKTITADPNYIKRVNANKDNLKSGTYGSDRRLMYNNEFYLFYLPVSSYSADGLKAATALADTLDLADKYGFDIPYNFFVETGKNGNVSFHVYKEGEKASSGNKMSISEFEQFMAGLARETALYRAIGGSGLYGLGESGFSTEPENNQSAQFSVTAK